jgi:hypothetical protein
MTNRELLYAPADQLGSDDRQKQVMLQAEVTPLPCPACRNPLWPLRASGLTIDEFDFGLTDRKYRCPFCLAELERVVPVIAVGPGWFWMLNHDWLAERLAKARQYDEDTALKEVNACPATPPG